MAANREENAENRDQKAAKPSRVAVLVVLWLAFGLRLYHLGAESLWYDETVSVFLARKDVPALLAHTAGDIHPPGYYLLLHVWQLWLQPSLQHGLEFLFAWPSLGFGLLVVALLYPLARSTGGNHLALLTIFLAAVNPFHLWYSQEVRMYTLGAALGLLCLWATLQISRPEANRRNGWLSVYMLAAAAGLYTLYYFLFLLVSLNLLVFWQVWFTNSKEPSGAQLPANSPSNAALRTWLLAQAGVLLLWSPWVPIFWRQVLDPPVPPWRVAWQTGAAFTRDLAETLAALLMGQSLPGATNWLWACATLLVIALALFALRSPRYVNQPGRNVTGWLLVYTFGPILLLYLLTWTITPLYHVRYLFTYAPPFLILVALALGELYRRQRLLGLLAVTGLVVANGWGWQQFWFAPQYRADDHRAAVAVLAQAWRPGDLILANAGWVYPTLLTYWPTELADAVEALPPALDQVVRVVELTEELPTDTSTAAQSPILVRLGSVDGSPRLGWADPRSDFFAVSSTATVDLLNRWSAEHPRIWHYRLYDTVSDPQGVIRHWLTATHTLLLDRAIPGRDFLRVQLYQTRASVPLVEAQPRTLATPIAFGAALTLLGERHHPTPIAGSTLYVQTDWQAAELAALPSPLAFSLRLYDEQGQLWAQADETALPPTQQWLPDMVHPLLLALPIPIATKPGAYQLALVVYDAATGQPLAAHPTTGAEAGIALGVVNVQVGEQAPMYQQRLATFDYVDLVTAEAQVVGQTLAVNLLWQPQPSRYTDTYLAVITLQNKQGAVLQQWQVALGGWDYPSGQWPAQIPVRDRYRLPLTTLPPAGAYTVTLGLVRNSDHSVIPRQQGWWPSTQAALPLATIEVK